MSRIIDIISEFVEITGNGRIDSILFIIAGIIAFTVAFVLVGIIFDSIGKYNSDLNDYFLYIRNNKRLFKKTSSSNN